MNYFSKPILLTLLLICLPSAGEQWQSVPTNSQLNYQVTFQGLPIEGRFKQFSVSYSPAQQLHVKVDIGSADMSDDELNREISGADWFDAGRFGEAVFNSDRLVLNNGADNQFVAKGSLKLKGISQQVSVPFLWTQDSKDSETATISGQLVLKRSDFSIGIGDWSSGDQIGIDVSVSFAVLMQRQFREPQH